MPECDQHHIIADKLDRVLRYSEKTVQALYGELGELNGAGIGLVARVMQQEQRITDIEEASEKTKTTAKEAIIAWLPAALAAIAAGAAWFFKQGGNP